MTLTFHSILPSPALTRMYVSKLHTERASSDWIRSKKLWKAAPYSPHYNHPSYIKPNHKTISITAAQRLLMQRSNKLWRFCELWGQSHGEFEYTGVCHLLRWRLMSFIADHQQVIMLVGFTFIAYVRCQQQSRLILHVYSICAMSAASAIDSSRLYHACDVSSNRDWFSSTMAVSMRHRAPHAMVLKRYRAPHAMILKRHRVPHTVTLKRHWPLPVVMQKGYWVPPVVM